MGEKLEIVYKPQSLSPGRAWAAIYAWLLDAGSSSSEVVRFYGKEMEISMVGAEIGRQGKDSFNVRLKNVDVAYTFVAARNHILISVECADMGEEKSWDPLVEKLVQVETFLSAWVVDSDYNFWQNARDPLHYSTRGMSLDGLKLKSNGLPHPLERMEIDISENPGRRLLRSGYVEAIGYIMWIGPDFWKVVGTEKDRVLALDFVKVHYLNEEVLRLQFSGKPFDDESDPAELEMIRERLYGIQ